MQHDTYVKENNVGMLPKLLAVLAVLAVLCAAGAYVVYGSGMWSPPTSLTHQ